MSDFPGGAWLASAAKHAPETITPEQIRLAGRMLERYEELLRGLSAFTNYGDTTEFIFEVDKMAAEDILLDYSNRS